MTLGNSLRDGVGAVIWCYGPDGKGCEWLTTYLTAQEAVDLFGPRVTYKQASRRLRCLKCGELGRHGKVSILPSTNDMADIRRGLPPGATETLQGARRLADRATPS